MSLVGKFASVGGATMATRVFGFVREALIGAALGAGPVADAFYAAFRFPNLFRRLFAEGAFNTAFVPLFAKELEGDGMAGARRFAEEVLSVLVVALLVLSVLAIVFMPALVGTIIAPAFADTPEKFDLTVLMTRIMFPDLFFMSLVAMLSGILNSMRRYFVAAIVPVLLNLILIGVLVGPYGLGGMVDRYEWLYWITISEPDRLTPFADFGIILLLFTIGLELSFNRLWAMRKMVFGLGSLEMIFCSALIAGGLMMLGNSTPTALALGMALALSSTALVLRITDPRTPVGKAALSMLLFEDIGRDANDCRAAWDRGDLFLRDIVTDPLVIDGVAFGVDSGRYANDGECDVPRFEGAGMTTTPLLDEDIRADASDCSQAWRAGTIRLRDAAPPAPTTDSGKTTIRRAPRSD
jgi:putative peptidoglycan lipid II flippase